MQWCDRNPNILRWGSEEFRIPYFHPVKQKICNYIPDFIIKYRDKDDRIITEILEVKPAKEAVLNLPGRKKISTYDQVQLAINNAKWKAAKEFCESHGIKFRVLTEHQLFRK